MTKQTTTTLDVRPILESGTDPFNTIMEALKTLPTSHTLEIVNSFEPIPLLNKLKKDGYTYETVREDDGTVHTFIKKQENPIPTIESPVLKQAKPSFEEVASRYETNLIELDVTQLEMPMPMVTILEALENTKEHQALYVHHQRLPQYLLPELEDRSYQWVSKTIDDHNIKLIIYK